MYLVGLPGCSILGNIAEFQNELVELMFEQLKLHSEGQLMIFSTLIFQWCQFTKYRNCVESLFNACMHWGREISTVDFDNRLSGARLEFSR